MSTDRFIQDIITALNAVAIDPNEKCKVLYNAQNRGTQARFRVNHVLEPVIEEHLKKRISKINRLDNIRGLLGELGSTNSVVIFGDGSGHVRENGQKIEGTSFGDHILTCILTCIHTLAPEPEATLQRLIDKRKKESKPNAQPFTTGPVPVTFTWEGKTVTGTFTLEDKED